MAEYARTRPSEAIPEALVEAWQHVDANPDVWSETARHDELLRLAGRHDAYHWLAGRYRARGKDAISEAQIARIARAVEATLIAGATQRDREPPRHRGLLVVVIGLVLAIAVLYAAIRLRDRNVEPSEPTIER
jgi:hypothetical protein